MPLPAPPGRNTMDSADTTFTNSTPATSRENSGARYELLRGCSPHCPHGTAVSRDFIARILRNASKTDVQDGSKRFVCRHTLINDLSARTVSSLLHVCPRGKGQRGTRVGEVAAYISPEAGRCHHCRKPRCTGARIIFVVLSHVAREEHVWDLVGSGVCDNDLPFCISETHLVSRKNRSKRLLKGMKGWPMEEKRLFCHFQWAMLSPYFKRRAVCDERIRRLDVEASLPLCEYEDDPSKNGDSQIEPFQPGESCLFDESKTIVKRVKISRHNHNLVSTPRFLLEVRQCQ
ncbi:hypothetical protein IMZ48_42770 [Candidatus Bathyarchaeota archaeon]|nr:hypothetical protein [Candidatus Bathyarchaeota archaeon]